MRTKMNVQFAQRKINSPGRPGSVFKYFLQFSSWWPSMSAVRLRPSRNCLSTRAWSMIASLCTMYSKNKKEMNESPGESSCTQSHIINLVWRRHILSTAPAVTIRAEQLSAADVIVPIGSIDLFFYLGSVWSKRWFLSQAAWARNLSSWECRLGAARKRYEPSSKDMILSDGDTRRMGTPDTVSNQALDSRLQ